MGSTRPDGPESEAPEGGGLRVRMWRIVFLADTPAGRAFDMVLLWAILASVMVVMLDSVESLRAEWRVWFITLEWSFTALFTIEYALRLWCSRRPMAYATSFFGVVDLLAVLPNYLSLVLGGSHYMATVRILRLMRIFRILKMVHHVNEANVLLHALLASRRKIFVFMTSVLALVCVEGSLMYVLENREGSRFESIPASIYWAIVTVTTVGYGDIVPATVAGKMLASFIMLTGFAILAVPTGIVAAEIGREVMVRKAASSLGRTCPACGHQGHEAEARHCSRCGASL
jgi:voltage-gated potassium channel